MHWSIMAMQALMWMVMARRYLRDVPVPSSKLETWKPFPWAPVMSTRSPALASHSQLVLSVRLIRNSARPVPFLLGAQASAKKPGLVPGACGFSCSSSERREG